jgi:hypothetical protein
VVKVGLRARVRQRPIAQLAVGGFDDGAQADDPVGVGQPVRRQHGIEHQCCTS